MLALNTPKTTEKDLMFVDYVTVHSLALKANQVHSAKPSDMQVQRDELFQRIKKQRGEQFKRIEKPSGDLIDVRLRVAA